MSTKSVCSANPSSKNLEQFTDRLTYVRIDEHKNKWSREKKHRKGETLWKITRRAEAWCEALSSFSSALGSSWLKFGKLREFMYEGSFC